ncbi:hypothetical protein SKAU_G00321580 [Synaphobranchus kaupii]|uniref:Uncharacterized protein n=1 Tax=Synaphobranchus kaupii TaxID=118154 RepID=A0A9Q1ENS0_SYNKA|nr:hypothetical protein SKAU_G00321580 [Synaphobranchus kaupii]
MRLQTTIEMYNYPRAKVVRFTPDARGGRAQATVQTRGKSVWPAHSPQNGVLGFIPFPEGGTKATHLLSACFRVTALVQRVDRPPASRLLEKESDREVARGIGHTHRSARAEWGGH